MRKLFALLSLLVVASMVLAACAPAVEAPAEEPAAEAPAAEEPAAEAPAAEAPAEAPMGYNSADPTTLMIAAIGEPETLDPALAYETAGGEIIQNVYETLVFYDGEATDKFVPQLAESWEISDDGTVYTFKIRSGVQFHDGADMTASDVAYSFQRGLLYGGYSGPQWLLAEPFFGIGMDDVSLLVDDTGALADDGEALAAADPALLLAACEKVTSLIVADDAAGTVTMTLNQAWGPFIATIAQGWGSVLDKDWAVANGAWDGDCATWQNYYAVPSESDPLTTIANGTGAFKLDHWTQGEELVLAVTTTTGANPPNSNASLSSPLMNGAPALPCFRLAMPILSTFPLRTVPRWMKWSAKCAFMTWKLARMQIPRRFATTIPASKALRNSSPALAAKPAPVARCVCILAVPPLPARTCS
jgi:peptide/nickel transport system substrate-binding protein